MIWFPSSTWYQNGGHWATQPMPDPINDDDVLTVAELKERAHINESDELLQAYISAARQQVERDTSCALPTQSIAVGYDTPPASGQPLLLPCPPLQELTSAVWVGADSTTEVIDPALFQIDFISMPARLWFTGGAAPFPLGPQGFALTLKVGWTKATLPPLLKFAVGLLASHYLTFGRDLATVDSVTTMPMGYAEAIQAYRLEVLV
jgi:uncharacterized phiE125 gp8 family phage protein